MTKQEAIATRNDFEMIMHEEWWPAWPLLPVKNKQQRDEEGLPMLGVICAGQNTHVKLTSLFDFDKDAKVLNYGSVNHLLEAGWIVD